MKIFFYFYNMELNQLLATLRLLRGFDEHKYLNEKIKKINQFFQDNKLDSAVVGISGGVDSAVTILLLQKAMQVENSPIKKILGLVVPIFGNGTTGQVEATNKAVSLLIKHQIDHKMVDLSEAYQSIIDESLDSDDSWAHGQMASVLRTPVFYYHAAILQSKGFKSLVVGTTNRDEGSYIGFFGKASDAMVDLQPIADIHKSEVYKLAHLLGVTEEIINDKPRGDVYDNKTDEEMIGTSYDCLELYLLMKEYEVDYTSLSTITCHKYQLLAKSIDELHAKNAHKYQVGSPAHFIDIMNRKINGGW